MSTPKPTRQPRPPTDQDAQHGWELAASPPTDPEPLRGGLRDISHRDISHRLAILTTAIAILTILIALGILLLPT